MYISLLSCDWCELYAIIFNTWTIFTSVKYLDENMGEIGTHGWTFAMCMNFATQQGLMTWNKHDCMVRIKAMY